ncbi:hypothetical protein BDZ97DRAFT_2055124 [Flammula alnicola]|nr:hypothetical protein BDZ97DRAFT_2055124 [Flammula alnicola]
MRLSPTTGKTDYRIIDFVDNNSRVRDVISAPVLFGLDPNHDKPFEKDGPADPHMASSVFAWVNCGDDIYLLTLHGPGLFALNPMMLTEAIRACDTFVEQKAFPTGMLLSSASWRPERVTQAQRNFIRGLRGDHPEFDMPYKVTKMTEGILRTTPIPRISCLHSG